MHIASLPQAHLNVEYCASVKSVKYLFKYVYKGHNVANATATLIHIAPPPEIVNDEGAAGPPGSP